jgi:hypothetical protein
MAVAGITPDQNIGHSLPAARTRQIGREIQTDEFRRNPHRW